MKLLNIVTALSLGFILSLNAEDAKTKTLMAKKGEVVINKNFDSKDEVGKPQIGFRKETKFTVDKGIFNAITPKMFYAGNPPEKSKWGTSDFARVTFANVPNEYITQVRVKFNEPVDAKKKNKGRAYFDMGHRNIRVTFTNESAKLVLSNHLLGKDSNESERLLFESKELKLEYNKWYDVITEIKGNEVVCQINGVVLYGKDELIKKERPTNFNIDQSGSGYQIDNIAIWKSADYQSNWNTLKASLGTKK